MTNADMLMGSIHGDGFNLCGIAPKVPLTTVSDWPCFNCEAMLVRRFSGSGWYEDDALCAECGESGTGYRPFRPRWRAENIAQAKEWLTAAVPLDEFYAMTSRLIKSEMGWDDPLEHEFVTFDERDVCDKCEQPAAAHVPASVDACADGVPTFPLDGVPTPGVD